MTEFEITAERSPDWDDAEVKRRLGRAYAIILQYNHQVNADGTADGEKFGDLTRATAEATAPAKAVPS